MSEIELTINGKAVKGCEGDSILGIALANGIDIPHLCHQAGLSDIGACRMCVVEVEGQRRPVPACATPAASGMVVTTENDKLWELRRQTVELLFSERNHICPFCTASGNCELQDMGYRLGMTHVRFDYLHPVLPADQSHRYIAIDHNRCILCSRCVRACDERAGVHTLGLEGRGRASMIVADDGVPLAESTCIACGECVDACPTGAIFEKRTSHWRREREVRRLETVCPYCGVGCKLDVALLNEAILEVRGADKSPNHGMLCKHGKFELTEARPNRIQTPLVREAGKLKAATYEDALDRVAKRLNSGRLAQDRGLAAGLVTSRLPVETLAGFGEFMRKVVGSERIGTLRSDVNLSFKEALGGSGLGDAALVEDVDRADVILSLGADPDEVQGVLSEAIRRAVRKKGAKLIEINPRFTALTPLAEAALEVRYKGDAAFCDALLKALSTYSSAKERMGDLAEEVGKTDLAAAARQSGVTDADIRRVAGLLMTGKRPLLMAGSGVARQGAEALRKALAVARALGPMDGTDRIGFMPLFNTSNGRAAGALGLDGLRAESFDGHSADILFLALGGDPEDVSERLQVQVRKASFSVVFASHPNEATAYADVVFPAPVWSEREGTFVNLEGRVQKSHCVTRKPEGVWDEAEVFRALAEKLGVSVPPDGGALLPDAMRSATDGHLM